MIVKVTLATELVEDPLATRVAFTVVVLLAVNLFADFLELLVGVDPVCHQLLTLLVQRG